MAPPCSQPILHHPLQQGIPHSTAVNRSHSRTRTRYLTGALVAAARRTEGVIHIDNQLSYDIDDRYPALPAGF